MNKEKTIENVWQRGATKALILAIAVAVLAVVIGAGTAIAKQNEEASGDSNLQATAKSKTMYRLYNQWTGEHFYTADEDEKNTNVKLGWNDEGVGWYAPTDTSLTPVYRLYNKYVEGGDHHYTMDTTERDNLVKAGWSDEGICWYSCDTTDENASPLYRQYNPYATTGTHNYTLNEDEVKEVVAAGWRDEGKAWYGYKTQQEADTDPDEGKTEIDFSKVEVTLTGLTYNGSQITPEVKIPGLTKGTDFGVSYGVNKNAGENAGRVIVTGKGNYTGSKTYYFDISPMDIEDANVALANDLTYNAEEQTQTVSRVWIDKMDLSASDYTVSGNKQTDAGDYTLTITGKGNFTGTVQAGYNVAQLDISQAEITLGDALTYTGVEQTQTVAAVVADGVTVPAANYTVSNNTGTEAQSYTLTVTGTKNCTRDTTMDFVINAADITDAQVTIYPNDNIYSGEAFTPQVTVMLDGKTLVKDTDYELEGDLTETEAGNYTITASGIGNYQNSASGSWRISGVGNYWLNVANSDTPEDKVLKTETQIAEDMEVLHGLKEETLSGKSKSELQTEYSNYMNGKSADGTVDQEIRLYTKWKGSDVIDDSSKNKYVEFRIIQVGEHDSDGSAVTFMATHSLPTAQAMNSSLATSDGSWNRSTMRVLMSSTFYVGRGLSGLVDGAKTINKETRSGKYASWSGDTTTQDQFWLLSHTEVFGTNGNTLTFNGLFDKEEGTQYAWMANQGVNAKTGISSTNKSIENLHLTRAGQVPTGIASGYTCWWQRSPRLDSSTNFGYVFTDGSPMYAPANNAASVVPCFAF